MTRFRFSIASLLGLVVFVAIAVASLRAASDDWDSALFTTTLALLLISVLLAVHRAEGKRAFWFGFCLFGGAYLLASLVPLIEPSLLTTKGLAYLDSKVPSRSQSIYEKLVVGLSNSIKQTKSVQGFALGPDALTVESNTDLGIIRLWDSATWKLLSGSGRSSENFMRIGHTHRNGAGFPRWPPFPILLRAERARPTARGRWTEVAKGLLEKNWSIRFRRLRTHPKVVRSQALLGLTQVRFGCFWRPQNCCDRSGLSPDNDCYVRII
jgi:hypothetical protein